MKHAPSSRRAAARAWRTFDRRDGRGIDHQIGCGDSPCCPLCGVHLEARPRTRMRRVLVLDARGFDLDCRECRRFWTVIVHTPRSLRLIRMRRLVAAVRAVREGSRFGTPHLAREAAVA